jgi:hypothetical protein
MEEPLEREHEQEDPKKVLKREIKKLKHCYSVNKYITNRYATDPDFREKILNNTRKYRANKKARIAMEQAKQPEPVVAKGGKGATTPPIKAVDLETQDKIMLTILDILKSRTNPM